MKKKIVSLCLCVALLAVAVIGGTLAYFTDTTEVKTNVFTVGDVEIKLDEPEWEEPETVEPGIEYSKDPTVTNIGTSDAWVRINVTLSDWAAFKTAAAKHNITDLSTIFADHDATKWTRVSITEDSEKDTVTYSYLFNEILAAEEDTGALFTSVTVPAAFDNDDMEAIAGEDGKFTIDVYAEAIQDADFADAAAAFDAFDDE